MKLLALAIPLAMLVGCSEPAPIKREPRAPISQINTLSTAAGIAKAISVVRHVSVVHVDQCGNTFVDGLYLGPTVNCSFEDRYF